MISAKEAFGLVAFAAAAVGTIPYIYSIIKGKTRPHFFTWLVWAILTVMIFIIQLTQGAGPGAWHMGMTALTFNNMVVVPIRTGVGLRLGANVGYLKFTPTATWNPF